ncbi:hypothetical protein [Helicovermis profundi]|uniref:Uncharacterized protein n=1 Tax=Helicovermis profundi TaxID=3065157 RepID=A0AAU9E4X1_9FIRM|nr:hypothetical protein HLPR_20470 [Clostridia bacterium S502]
MKRKIIFLILVIFLFSGCSNIENNTDKRYKVKVIDNTENEAIILGGDIKGEFNILLSKTPSEKEVLDYIDKYIVSSDSETNDYLIYGFERVQKKNIKRRVNNFFRGNIQEKFSEEDYLRKNYVEIDKIEDLSYLQDKELRSFVLEYLQIGYKIIGKNGVFYPEINYDFYLKYKKDLSLETNIYFELMQKEYASIVINDGSLNITWDEVFKRILLAEKYVTNYKSAEKYDEVSELYKKYVEIYLFGTPNTPAFDGNNKLKKYLKQSYDNVYLENLSSIFVLKLREYFKLLKQSNYYLDDVVDKYRSDIRENINQKK